MDVTAIIPSLNPDARFVETVRSVSAAGFDHILVVNDGSGSEFDTFFEQAANVPGCTVLRHDCNRGKGRALKTAFSYFLEHFPQDVGAVTLDADGQHRPEDAYRCALALQEHPDCLIIGARDFSLPQVPRRSRWGNRITSFVFKNVCGIPCSDTQTGLRAIPSAYCKYLLDVKGERFDFETNMLLETRSAQMDLFEVTVDTVYSSTQYSSHFHVFRDSFAIYKLIFKYVSSSLLATLLDYLVFETLILFLQPKNVGDAVWRLVAVISGRLTSSIFNFTVNRKVVFRSSGGLKQSLVRYYTLWAILAAGSYFGITLLTMIGVPDAIGKIPVDILLFLVGFRFQSCWVFGKTENNKK